MPLMDNGRYDGLEVSSMGRELPRVALAGMGIGMSMERHLMTRWVRNRDDLYHMRLEVCCWM